MRARRSLLSTWSATGASILRDYCAQRLVLLYHTSWRCDQRGVPLMSGYSVIHVRHAAAQATFRDLQAVVAALQARNVAPALEWAASHRDALRRGSQGRVSSLEFALYKLQFLTVLQTVRSLPEPPPCSRRRLMRGRLLRRQEGRSAAVKYARTHFKDLDETHVRASVMQWPCECRLSRSDACTHFRRQQRFNA